MTATRTARKRRSPHDVCSGSAPYVWEAHPRAHHHARQAKAAPRQLRWQLLKPDPCCGAVEVAQTAACLQASNSTNDQVKDANAGDGQRALPCWPQTQSRCPNDALLQMLGMANSSRCQSTSLWW
eukprot:363637-Chlamydomonas_euryale.AAC.4